MIESMTIHNFQCHRDLTLKLGQSTVLQGDSNHGKTAVLRALYWVAFNTPQGSSYVSDWAKDGEKYLGGEYTEVSVQVDGHTIVRRRDNKFNGYVVDGVSYEALRGAVPDAVTKLLGLSDVSIQRQLDPPFLLSLTPGEAATFLNALAGLENVSSVLSSAKRLGAEATAEVTRLQGSLEEAEAVAQSYGWVEEAARLIPGIEEAEAERLSAAAQALQIKQTLDEYERVCTSLHPLERALRALPEPVDAQAEIAACQAGIEALRGYRDTLATLSALESAEKALGALGSYPEADFTQSLVLGRLLHEYEALGDPQQLGAEISSLEASLAGAVCPLCGQPYLAHNY